MQNLSIETISSFETFLSLEKEWNSLLTKSNNDSVFLRHEWFRVWWENFGDKKELYVLLAKEREELVGIAPFMLVKEKVGQRRPFAVRQVRFIENGEAPYLDFIVKDKRVEILQSFLTYLQSNCSSWDIVVLKNIPEDSLLFKSSFDGRIINKLKLRVRKTIYLPYLRSSQGWETYFTSRSKRFRGAIRHSRNKINKLGDIQIKKVTECTDVANILSDIWAISKNSWKHQVQGNIIASDKRKKFFSELTKIAVEKGWLNLWLLTKAETPLAFEYHLTYNSTVYALLAEYDQNYKTYSPGFVLGNHIVESTFQNGILEYNMGPSEELYKMRWTDTVRKHKIAFLFHRGVVSRLLELLECAILPFAGRFKTTSLNNS